MPESSDGGGSELATAGRLGGESTGGRAVRENSTSRTKASAGRSRFSFLARSAAASPAFNATVGLGRIPASEPRGLSLQLVLQTLPTMASEAGCGSTPGVQSRREGVRGLGRSDAPRARSDHRSDLASISIRAGAGSELLHLRRSYTRSATDRLDQRAYPRVRIFWGSTAATRSRQSANRWQSRVSLLSRSQPTLPRDGYALRHGSCTVASLPSAGQGQG